MEERKSGKQQSKKIQQLTIGRILPGMVTARDVYSRNDQLVLNRETTLDSIKIAKIMFYAIESIYVYESSDQEIPELTFLDQLKNSAEFRVFKKNYDASVQALRSAFTNTVEKKEPLDTKQLLKDVNLIITNAKSRTDVFYMLHCIREYDDLTYVHSVNVSLICNIFAEWLGMTREDKEVLTLCGLLHDIGKLTIPRSILDKPEELNEEEYEAIKLHTKQGYELIKDMDIDERIKQAVLLHHERYNGTGYPFHRTGDEIDSFAMLTAIADVFDAMTCNRVYRPSVSPFDAIEEFEGNGKQLFRPQYLIPLMERIAETYISHTVRLNTEQDAEVVMLNRDFLSKPLVRVNNEFIDLSLTKNMKIKHML